MGRRVKVLVTVALGSMPAFSAKARTVVVPVTAKGASQTGQAVVGVTVNGAPKWSGPAGEMVGAAADGLPSSTAG
jgi:hypothetical protein